MNLFRVDFQDLYERHLCRHSQFGINVIHLVSVCGIYLAVFTLALRLVGSPWLLLAILVPYFTTLAFNIPLRVLVVSMLCMALLVAVFWLPPLPDWLFRSPVWLVAVLSVALIILSHKVQLWSHKIYDKERDMTEFNKKYQKGVVLFLLLSVYELPILLYYLRFDRKSWTA